MDYEIAHRWANALRSGDYVKGTGALRTPANEFCCLGVLCNLHAQAHPDIAARQTDPEYYMGRSAVLPDPVRDWAGMKTDNGKISCSTGSLAYLNDNGKTFEQLANIIERKWSLL